MENVTNSIYNIINSTYNKYIVTHCKKISILVFIHENIWF